ncbi:MAG: hypothetical protein J2O46_06440 [Nocardioides sp.]|nr:hypothetical protein [Nocardioides sp.]
MARRLFLHVGAPKTGTTYIQDRLYNNRGSLEESGVVYPVGADVDLFKPALDLLDRDWGGMRDTVHGEWEKLVRRVNATDAETIVVSHEILAGSHPEKVERAMHELGRRHTETHVVYTARDIARQVPAEWQEEVKHRSRMRFRGFLRRVQEAPRRDSDKWFWRVQGLPDVLTRWGRGLPPERVHLITVPPPGAPKDALWLRFCEVVGIDPATAPADSDRKNVGLGTAEATLVRRLNERLEQRRGSYDMPFGYYAHIVHRLVAEETLAHREGKTSITLPPDAYDWAEEIAEEWITWAKDAGIDVTGSLDELRPLRPEADADWHDPDAPPADEMVDAALDALAEVLLEASQRPAPDHPATKVVNVLRRAKEVLS